MAARKVTRSLTCTASGFTAPIIGAPPHAGTEAEVAKVIAFGDDSKTAVVSPLAEYADMTITVLDEGDVDPPVPGAAAAEWTITTKYNDGGSGADATRTFVRMCQVTKVEPAVVEVDGNRRAAWTITLTPQGGDDPASTKFGVG